jgi:hypothetical protein
MPLKQRIKANPLASATLTMGEHVLRHALYGRHLDAAPRRLDAGQRRLLNVLDVHGIAVIPGYWTGEDCRAAIAVLDAFTQAHPDRTWVGPYGADHRVYGLERLSPVYDRFYRDRRLFELAEAYWGASVVNGFVSAGRLEAGVSNEGSGAQTWHKDGVTQQFKAILYLDDVGPDNGPFQYVRNTALTREVVRHIFRSGGQFRQLRWNDAQIAAIERTAPGSVVTCCGPAGTLVIANTLGIHRGAPIAQGRRYALTNYYFAKSTLSPVADYYNRQLVQADGELVTPAYMAAFEPG